MIKSLLSWRLSCSFVINSYVGPKEMSSKYNLKLLIKSLTWVLQRKPTFLELCSHSFSSFSCGRQRGKTPRLPECIMHRSSRAALSAASRLLLFQEQKMTGFYFLTVRHPLPERGETELKNSAGYAHTLPLPRSPLSFFLSFSKHSSASATAWF